MLLFFFLAKKKRRGTLGKTFRKGLSGERCSPLRFVRQTLNYYVNHPHKSQSEKQHCRYRKRQTRAFASPRRTARETSDSAGRVEQVFPRIVFSGMGKDYRANNVRPYDLCGKRHNNNLNHPHKKHPEKQHCRYRKRQTKAFASQRRTARVTSDSAGRVFGVISRIIYPPALSASPFSRGTEYSSALSGISSKRGDILQSLLYRGGDTKCRRSPGRTMFAPTVCLVLGCQRKLTGGLNPRSSLRAFFQGRQKTPLPIHFKMFHVKHQSLRHVICVILHASCLQKHRCAGLSETQTKPSMRMSARQNEKTPADTRECQHTLKNSG